MSIKRFLFLAVSLMLVLTACGLPTKVTPTPINYIQTAAAGTVIAQLTQATSAPGFPTATLQPAVQPSTTLAASTTIKATTTPNTPPPTQTSAPAFPSN